MKTTETIPHNSDPQDAAAQADAAAQSLLADAELHSVSWAIDPTRWELLILTLHATQDGTPTGSPSALDAPWEHANCTTYEVLHLSAPEIDALT